ncbi:hypothetical protein N9W22_01485 [Schleiferiaceae bacterium]|nr:hypothetical protein [Schleiferiaceae bacterium]
MLPSKTNSAISNSLPIALLFLLFYSLYYLVPFLQYFVLGIGDPFDPYFTSKRFLSYTLEFIMFILAYKLTSTFFRKTTPTRWRFRVSVGVLLMSMLFGSFLLIVQFIYTDAYEYGLIDRSLGLTKFHSLPEIYVYFFMPGYVLILHRFKELKYIQKIVFYSSLLAYFIIWYIMGSRGELLLPLLFWLSSGKKKLLSLRNLLIMIPLIIAILYSSISTRWQVRSIKEVINVVIEHPEALSLADLEFAWGLRNFNKLDGVDFRFDYMLESHVEGFLKGPAGLLGIHFDDPPNRYRYEHNAERVQNGATYGGTGFSLFYEAREAFGPFSFVQYFLLWSLMCFISLNLKKSNVLQVFAALLLPNFLLIIRAGLPLGMILTKAVYTIVIISLFLLLERVFLKGARYV